MMHKTSIKVEGRRRLEQARSAFKVLTPRSVQIRTPNKRVARSRAVKAVRITKLKDREPNRSVLPGGVTGLRVVVESGGENRTVQSFGPKAAGTSAEESRWAIESSRKTSSLTSEPDRTGGMGRLGEAKRTKPGAGHR